MRVVNLDERVTITCFDKENNEYSEKVTTIEKLLTDCEDYTVYEATCGSCTDDCPNPFCCEKYLKEIKNDKRD